MVLGVLIRRGVAKFGKSLSSVQLLTPRIVAASAPVVASTTPGTSPSSLLSSSSSSSSSSSINRQTIRSYSDQTKKDKPNQPKEMDKKVVINKEELKSRLTPLQYQVTQEAATERPFSGCYNKHYEKGVYQCIVCHQDLFSSDTKYDSGCGWPAFNDVLDQGKITLHKDASIPGGNILLLIKHPERIRTEVRCAQCNAHMGHVFGDGPKPTRKRYCINSAAIRFVTADELNGRGNNEAATATAAN